MELISRGISLEEIMSVRAYQHSIPINGVLELLPMCNMNCDMCYVRLSREEMERKGGIRTIEEWVSLAQEMKDAGTLFLLLTGGEPLIFPKFKQLFVALQKMGMIIAINTNGTLIDEEWADFFKEHRPRRINITLYGKNDEAYQKLCHYPGGFEKVIHGIKLLRERNIDVKLNGSLVRSNSYDWKDIVHIGDVMKVPVRIDAYMYPGERERSVPFDRQSRMEPEEAARCRANVLLAEMGEETFRQYARQKLEKYENTFGREENPLKISCRAGKTSFTINWQGDMMPCVLLDAIRIPVFEKGFMESWNEIGRRVEELELSAECGSCSWRNVCDTCPACALLECGDYKGIPEYMCRYTKASLKEFQKKLEALD